MHEHVRVYGIAVAYQGSIFAAVPHRRNWFVQSELDFVRPDTRRELLRNGETSMIVSTDCLHVSHGMDARSDWVEAKLQIWRLAGSKGTTALDDNAYRARRA